MGTKKTSYVDVTETLAKLFECIENMNSITQDLESNICDLECRVEDLETTPEEEE